MANDDNAKKMQEKVRALQNQMRSVLSVKKKQDRIAYVKHLSIDGKIREAKLEEIHQYKKAFEGRLEEVKKGGAETFVEFATGMLKIIALIVAYALYFSNTRGSHNKEANVFLKNEDWKKLKNFKRKTENFENSDPKFLLEFYDDTGNILLPPKVHSALVDELPADAQESFDTFAKIYNEMNGYKFEKINGKNALMQNEQEADLTQYQQGFMEFISDKYQEFTEDTISISVKDKAFHPVPSP